MRRVHLDTDIGGDPDDACALTMLLGTEGIEITGITTVADNGGMRAAYVRHLLALAGRTDIPVAQGAGSTLTSLGIADPFTNDDRYWPLTVTPQPLSPPGSALTLLANSIDAGATVIGTGCYTNLAILETLRPGSLNRVPVFVMGGCVIPANAGLPQWGPAEDWNVQWDPHAAGIVGRTANLTLATLPATMRAHLRGADLPRLERSGPLGQLLARQAAAYGGDRKMSDLAESHQALPYDLLNFQWDAVTCAVALGWQGTTIQTMTLNPIFDQDMLRFEHDPRGRPIRVVTDIDGSGFSEMWLASVEAADSNRVSP